MIKFLLAFFGLRGDIFEQCHATTVVLGWACYLPLVAVLVVIVALIYLHC